jgi:hypothetical protein
LVAASPDTHWKCLGRGCHLNRKIDDLVAAAEFYIDSLNAMGETCSPSCMKASRGPRIEICVGAYFERATL